MIEEFERNNLPHRVAITGHSFPDIEIEREILSSIANVADTRERDGPELHRTLAGAVAVINQSANLTSEVISTLDRCRVIVEYGIGVDRIDVEAASARGIQVCNVPDYCIEEVSTHAMAMMLALERQIPFQMEALRSNGVWGQPEQGSVRRFRGRRLGLVGVGRIARRFAELAKPLGLQIFGFDPYLGDSVFDQAGITRLDLPELMSTADYISIHCPLTPQTLGLIGAEQLALVKPDAIVINVSRGKVIQEQALVEALGQGRLRGAALDVFENEPLSAASPLLTMSNVVVTPHLAWISREAEEQLKREAADEVLRVLSGQPPKSPVNKIPV